MDNSGAQSGIDIPSTNSMVLVCRACLDENWVPEIRSQPLVVRTSGLTVNEEWRCGTCDFRTAVLMRRSDRDRLLIERAEANP